MKMSPKLKKAVKEYKAGNVESFTSLYKESYKYIYVCVSRNAAGKSNANDIIEEVMQETYLEIILNIGSLRNEDAFLVWAGRIAYNKYNAYVGKKDDYILLDEDDTTLEDFADSDEIIPEEVMQNKEKRRLVREIIDNKLTEPQRLCIIGYYYNLLKQSEIAEILGIPENTVKTHLARARVKIKEGVLDLEKNKDTKLYSAAPFFLLLFADEVQAAVVPAELSAKVLAFLSEALGATSVVTAKTGIWAKIAAASTKVKIMMAVATVSAVGTVGGTLYVVSQNNNESRGDVSNTTIAVESTVLNTEKQEISYVEMEACFWVEHSEDADRTLVDGEIMDWTQWERLGTRIQIAKSLDIYDANKRKVGYTKENIKAVYVAVNDAWSQLAIGESGFSVYVRTAELLSAMGADEVVYEEGEDAFLISNGAYGEGYYDGKNIDMNALEPGGWENILSEELNIYGLNKKVIGYLKRGTFIRSVTRNEEWTYVSIEDGGYIVRTEELKQVGMVEEMHEVMIVQEDVTIYRGPGIEYEAQGNYAAKDRAVVIGEVTNGWYQITDEGRIGYVDGNYIAEFEVIVETPSQSEYPTGIMTPEELGITLAPSGGSQTVTTVVDNYPSGNYSPGSVYGPKLTQEELNQVAVAVNYFMESFDMASMDDYTKVQTAHDYLCNNVSYAASWAVNRANSAWGALVYGEAQCSGYARAMKALCDAMGVGCYYVHADENAFNPSHQWNEVCVDGEWYIIDVQCNDSSGWNAIYLVSDDYYAARTGMSWDRSIVPACPYDYMGF